MDSAFLQELGEFQKIRDALSEDDQLQIEFSLCMKYRAWERAQPVVEELVDLRKSAPQNALQPIQVFALSLYHGGEKCKAIEVLRSGKLLFPDAFRAMGMEAILAQWE